MVFTKQTIDIAPAISFKIQLLLQLKAGYE